MDDKLVKRARRAKQLFLLLIITVVIASGCQKTTGSSSKQSQQPSEKRTGNEVVIYGKGNQYVASNSLSAKLKEHIKQLVEKTPLEKSQGLFPNFKNEWENNGIALECTIPGQEKQKVFLPLEPTTNTMFINNILYETHQAGVNEAATMKIPQLFDETLASIERDILASDEKSLVKLWKQTMSVEGSIDMHLRVPDVEYDNSVYRAHFETDNHGTQDIVFSLALSQDNIRSLIFPYTISVMQEDVDRARLIQRGEPVILNPSQEEQDPDNDVDTWPSRFTLRANHRLFSHGSFLIKKVTSKNNKPLKLEARWIIYGDTKPSKMQVSGKTKPISVSVALKEAE